MSRRHAALLVRILVVLAVVGAGITPPVTASSPPEPIVPVGQSTFAEVAFEHGAPVDEADLHVTATARLDDDGSATWTVRHRIEDDAVLSTWRNDSDELDTVVRATLDDYDGTGAVEEPKNVSWTLDGDTLVVTLTDPAAAERGYGGQLVVEYLRASHGDGVELDADRLTLVGPSGTTVTHASSGRVDGRTVVLTEEYPHEGPLVFGASGTGGFSGDVAAVLSNDDLWPTLSVSVGYPLVFASMVLGAVAVVGSAIARRSRPDGVVVLVVGCLGALAVAYGIRAGLKGRRATFSAFVGIGLTTVLSAYGARVGGTRGVRMVRYLPAVVALVVVATMVGMDGTSLDRLVLPFVFTVALVPRFGFQSRYGLRQALTSGALVLVGAAVVLFTFTWPQLERGLGLALLLVAFGLLVFTVLALPLFVTGRLVESENSKRLTGLRAENET